MSETSSPFIHPDRIGPYHILRVIGEGGMGIVFEAEQRAPVRRRVALKMMKAGLDTKEVIGRFETERQALAVMDHPGIAKVFDAGATEAGRPYFVMELVRGIRLDRYCDMQQLTTRRRVELFIRICDAVQHAHLKGVIHRDLKPSNILVTDEDGAASAKVIDFGVAKAVWPRLTEHTIVTTHGQAVGTLAYMSPEQAEMSGLDVDTRADIYSLGVLLHELLAGVVPIDPRTVGAPAFLARLIQRDHTMPTLDRTLSAIDPARLAALARSRSTDGNGLKKELSGDIRWIVGKAMEKDRSRRYETASGLARDIQRYLRDKPIDARPPSRAYSLRKFVRRHRSAVLAATFAFVALATGGLAAAAGLVRARAAEKRAASETTTATQVTRFLVDLFDVSDPGEARGNSITAREILDQGAERIRNELADQPAVQGRLMLSIGQVYRKLGLYSESQELLEEAVRVQERAGDADATGMAGTLQALASLYEDRGQYADAEPLYRQALDLLVEQLGEEHEQVATAANNLGVLLNRRGHYDEAEALYRKAARVSEATLGPTHPKTASMLGNLAVLYRKVGRYADAEAMQRRTLEIAETTLGKDHPTYTTRLVNLGALYQEVGRYTAAEPLFKEALEIDERIFGPDHPNIAIDLANLTAVHLAQGRLEEGEAAIRRALDIDSRAHGPDHPAVGADLLVLARVQDRRSQPEEAEATFDRALRVIEGALGPSHPQVAQALVALGSFHVAHGRMEAAESVLERALAILAGGSMDQAVAARALHELAIVRIRTGHPDAADSMFARALDIRERALGMNHPVVAETLEAWGESLEGLGQSTRSDSLLARARQIRATAAIETGR